jgi:hypothetical protein
MQCQFKSSIKRHCNYDDYWKRVGRKAFSLKRGFSAQMLDAIGPAPPLFQDRPLSSSSPHRVKVPTSLPAPNYCLRLRQKHFRPHRRLQ